MNDLLIYDNGACKISMVNIDGFIRYEVKPQNKNYGTCIVKGIYTAIDIAKRISKHERKFDKLR